MTVDDVCDTLERGRLYAILDAAGAPDVPGKMIEPAVEAEALYSSRADPHLAYVAPYLVRVDWQLMAWIQEKLWADYWGIFIEADMELVDLRRHLRHFLLVKDPQDRTLYFRFYDPRVLRTFLPTCNADELAEFFGPIEACIARGQNPNEFMRFALAWEEVPQIVTPSRSASRTATGSRGIAAGGRP